MVGSKKLVENPPNNPTSRPGTATSGSRRRHRPEIGARCETLASNYTFILGWHSLEFFRSRGAHFIGRAAEQYHQNFRLMQSMGWQIASPVARLQIPEARCEIRRTEHAGTDAKISGLVSIARAKLEE
jgi:hypothetical protein